MKRNGFTPALILIIIAVLGIVGYFTYKNIFQGNFVGLNKSGLHSPLPTSTANTSNWNSFNSKFKYSIKYPTGWTIETLGNTDPKTSYNPVLNSPCDYESGDLCSQVFISSVPYGSALNPNDAYPVINSEDKFAPDFVIDSNDKVLNKTSLTVDGEKAYGFEYFQSTYSGTRWQYVVVFDHNSIRYTLTYEEQQKDSNVLTPSDWRNKQIFDTMLSTFKFSI